MTRSYARLLVVSLALSLVACDGTEVDPPAVDPLVGVWLLTDLTSTSYATATRDVVSTDLSVPGEGTLTATRDSSASGPVLPLRHVIYADAQALEDAQVITLRSFGLNDPHPSGPWAELRLSRTARYASWLTIGRGYYETWSSHIYEPPSFTVTPAGVVVEALTLEGYDNTIGQTVRYTVGGRLDLVIRSFRAGVETEIAPFNAFALDGASELRAVFEDDGTYHNQTTVGNRTTSVTGRWEASNGRLRVSVEEPSWNGTQAVTIDYDYRIEGGALVLTAEPTACDRWCVDGLASTMRLPAGSLQAARTEVRYRYAPSESRWLPPAEGPALTAGEVRSRLLPGAGAPLAR